MATITPKSAKKLLKTPNVVGFFTGRQHQDGDYKGHGLVVTVNKKLPKESLKRKELIPQEIDGQKTDVIEVGDLKALSRTSCNRPFRLGDSCGVYTITAGTAGWLVDKDGQKMLLSNNHVLANVNKAKIGDPILQPGTYDGGTVAACKIGSLHSFAKIVFEGAEVCSISSKITRFLNLLASSIGSAVRFSFQSFNPQAISNKVDCALCKLDSTSYVSPEVLDLGSCADGSLQVVALLFAGSDKVTIGNKIQNVASALDVTVPYSSTVGVGETVWKSGRTTGVTSGQVIATDYTGIVNMGAQGSAIFADQILIGTPGFSAGGDSGSAIVRKST